MISCRKKSQQTEQYPVKNVPVNVTIYPNDPQYQNKLQALGGWVYYNGAGINGLIIYRKTQQDFVAIERTSPENPDNPASAVKVQQDNFTLKDTLKNSVWQIVDGAAMNNSSKWPLKLYSASYDGNVLYIRN